MFASSIACSGSLFVFRLYRRTFVLQWWTRKTAGASADGHMCVLRRVRCLATRGFVWNILIGLVFCGHLVKQ